MASSSSRQEKYPEVQVLEQLMQDGTFDELRQKIVKELREKDELKQFAKRRVKEELKRGDWMKSRVEKLTSKSENERRKKEIQKEILGSLRSKLEKEMTDEISRAAWKLMSGKNQVTEDISTKVHEVFSATVASKEYQEKRQAAHEGPNEGPQ